jgi:hypothetical protein
MGADLKKKRTLELEHVGRIFLALRTGSKPILARFPLGFPGFTPFWGGFPGGFHAGFQGFPEGSEGFLRPDTKRDPAETLIFTTFQVLEGWVSSDTENLYYNIIKEDEQGRSRWHWAGEEGVETCSRILTAAPIGTGAGGVEWVGGFRLFPLGRDGLPPSSKLRPPSFERRIPNVSYIATFSYHPNHENGASVDYLDHCTVVQVIADAPKRTSQMHVFQGMPKGFSRPAPLSQECSAQRAQLSADTDAESSRRAWAGAA